MKKIAILASDNMIPGHPDQRGDSFERDEQMAKLVPAFAKLGMSTELVAWRQAATRAGDFDAMLPLFVWDYFEGNEQSFLAEIEKVDQKTLLLNPFLKLKWNANKSYLDQLADAGAPVIPTVVLDRASRAGVTRAIEELQADTVVIKPKVGGGAWRQILYKQGTPFPESDVLPPDETMVQPFLPSVQAVGEYSMVYFDGEFSHALLKRPKDGDYRIQSLYGGTEETYDPDQDELASAGRVLAALDFVPLYARVDLLRGLDDQLKLIELEMIEPYLYLAHSEGEGADNVAASKLAGALARRIDGSV